MVKAVRGKIHGQKINMLWFADDLVIIAENEEDLKQILEIMKVMTKR